MRTACLDCTLKHLGEAAIWDMEVQQGYPQFRIYVVGSLAHASTEVHKVNPALAMVIREHRLAWMEDMKHDVPYEALGTFVTALQALPDNAARVATTVPEECREGLLGELTGDTRPLEAAAISPPDARAF